MPTISMLRRGPRVLHHRIATVVALCVIAACVPLASGARTHPAEATGAPTFYVSTRGSDAASGSREHPFRTIQHAVDVVPPKSRIRVREGTYRGFQVTRDAISVVGAPGARVRIEGGAEDTVEFKGVQGGQLRHVRVLGSDVQYGSAVRVTDSRNVIVRHVRASGAKTFGILVVDSVGVRLLDNDVSRNASGIEERRAVELSIAGNDIHHNLKAVDAGRGAEGITFFESTGSVHVVGNRFSHNGTHLEVYGASHLTIEHNQFRAGEVMETGTAGPACAGNRFLRNIAVRGDVGSDGMILRCAKNMVVANNVFEGFDDFAAYVVDGTSGVAFGGSIEGLRVVNNIVVGGRAWSLGDGLPDSVVIDYNLINIEGSTAQYGSFLAYVKGLGNVDRLSQLRSWTGFERHGRSADPRFVDRRAGDFHLRRRSPAIDAGTVVLGGNYLGSAPDLGRYETR